MYFGLLSFRLVLLLFSTHAPALSSSICFFFLPP